MKCWHCASAGQEEKLCSIALTSGVSKVFTSLVKRRWLAYMVNNGLLNTAIQKVLVDDVPGCSEHHLKLLPILQEAQRRRKPVCVGWLDLANAFESIHHDLITFSLANYHIPQQIIESTGVQTPQWTIACHFHQVMDHCPHPPAAWSLPG